jgi:hypothetical protein
MISFSSNPTSPVVNQTQNNAAFQPFNKPLFRSFHTGSDKDCQFLKNKKWIRRIGLGGIGLIALSYLYKNREALLKDYPEFIKFKEEARKKGISFNDED